MYIQSPIKMFFILTAHSYSFWTYLYNLSHRLTELNVSLGFKLAIRNSLFAKCFGSLRMSFWIFSKNCESLKSDTSWIFKVIYWTCHIVTYFKPIKYPLLNNNVISQRFIVHINFKFHTSFFSNYHFVMILQIVSLW